ncbi:TetR/AcrR family transcriptional regulator [Nocardia sp. NPDC050712]|uniref:TetR/AcrR family transcriptional regulator n=1 Tax=Nocardia sp. NPDC050712 TaxID=3155518 RepID=UPI0033D4DE64
MPSEKSQVGSVWTRPRKGRDQPALTREHIVAEAVALLDAEGMEALTMRQLGARLNAGATSLYRHVANRDELIELVVDEVYGEIAVPAITEPAEWRTATAQFAGNMRAMILRHPWMAVTLSQVGLSHLGPNVSRMTDRMIALFQAGGFAPDEVGDALSALSAYVAGGSASEAAWLTTLARAGQTEAEMIAALRPAVEQAAADFPRLTADFAAEDWTGDPAETRARKFAYGLDRILDGLDPRRRA